MTRIDLALVICNQGEDREKAVAALLKCGLSPICCSNLQEARTLLCQEAFRVVFCADTLSDGNFRAVLRDVKKSTVHAPVIVLSHAADWHSCMKALRAGAYDYLVCPPDPAEAKGIICAALADTVVFDKTAHPVC